MRANDYRVMRDRALKAESEVERLEKELASKNLEYSLLEREKAEDVSSFVDDLKFAGAEAIKEFAERLKAKEAIHFCKCGEPFVYTDLFNGEVDNLVKEMVGE